MIDIRPVQPGDLPGWRPLWDGYNAFYGRSGATALPEAVTAQTWSRFVDEDAPMYALIAVEGEQVLGLVHYLFHPSTSAESDSCYLQDLFTAEAARGRGIGRSLIEAVYTAAARAGSGRVYWHTHDTNRTAMALYDSLAEKPGFLLYRKLV